MRVASWAPVLKVKSPLLNFWSHWYSRLQFWALKRLHRRLTIYFETCLSCQAVRLHWNCFLSACSHFHLIHSLTRTVVKANDLIFEDPREKTGTCPDVFQLHCFRSNLPKWSLGSQSAVEVLESLIGSSSKRAKLIGGIALVESQMTRQFQSLHEQAAGFASHSSGHAYSFALLGSHSPY